MTSEDTETDEIIQSESRAIETTDFATELPSDSATDDADDNAALAVPKTALLNVPVQVMVSVGFATVKIGELTSLTRDTLLNLNTKVDDPVQIIMNGKTIASGILEESADTGHLQVRVSKITDSSISF